MKEWQKYPKRPKRDWPLSSDTPVQYYNYKEPLRKFEDGFGYIGTLAANKENTHVQCHFCGILYKALSGHIGHVHGLTAREYKEKLELSMGTALVAETTRVKQVLSNSVSEYVKTRVDESKFRLDLYRRRTNNTSHWSLERRNKLGLCPDQVLDKIRNVIKELGRTPTIKEFIEHSNGYETILTLYGTWNNALEMIDVTPVRSRNIPDDKLIKYMQDFFNTHGRTPSTSDFKRGLIGYRNLYGKRFGSLNGARMIAGIPIIKRGAYGKAYETMEYQNELP